jgi:hypothetical protein
MRHGSFRMRSLAAGRYPILTMCNSKNADRSLLCRPGNPLIVSCTANNSVHNLYTMRNSYSFLTRLLHFIHSWQKWYAPICFIALLIDRYNDRLLPLLRQFHLISNRNNKFMHLVANCSTPCLKQICWNLINLWVFSFSVANSTSKAFGSDTGSAVCISVCLTSLTPCTLNCWEK